MDEEICMDVDVLAFRVAGQIASTPELQTGANSFLRFKLDIIWAPRCYARWTQGSGPLWAVRPLGLRVWGHRGMTPVRPTGPGTKFPPWPGPAPARPRWYPLNIIRA